MSLENTELKNDQNRNHFLDVALISLALVVAFHFLPANHPFGIAFGIFVICLAAGMILVAGLGQKKLSLWPYLFLVPVLLCALADTFYASHVVQGLAFVISLASLTFFAFWLTVPKISFRHIRTFWPIMFLKETLWPLKSLSLALSRFKGDRRLGGIVIGTIIAIPFLLVFVSVFAAADQVFSKAFSNIFQSSDFAMYVFKIIRDLIVFVFFLASGSTMLTRLVEERKIPEAIDRPIVLNQTVYVTFLGLINILFLVFVGFQFAYFFGGQAWVTAQGITYANYAREGFFQLLFAAGLVFGMAWVIYWLTEMRQRWTKILAIVLIVQTGIIIVSALKRLMLYIDAYGLTLARWWAAFCIVLIGLTLLMVVVCALKRMSYAFASKIGFLGILIVTSLMLLVPTEHLIAGYDVDRFLKGSSKLDFGYLSLLSSDAMSERVRLANAEWPADKNQYIYSIPSKENYIKQLKDKRPELESYISKVGLGASLADHWALNTLDGLK